MRRQLALCGAAALLCGGAPGAVRVDLPHDQGAQEAVVLERTFPVGGSSGWHTHPGIEIGHVVTGVTELRTPGAPPRRYGAGETFIVARGAAHEGVNVGDEPARLVITYLIDKGAPLRAGVPDPAER